MTKFITRQKISGDMSDDNTDNWNDLFISKEDYEKEIQKNDSRIVLTTTKGMPMVFPNTEQMLGNGGNEML